jgi:hypothetical protein
MGPSSAMARQLARVQPLLSLRQGSRFYPCDLLFLTIFSYFDQYMLSAILLLKIYANLRYTNEISVPPSPKTTDLPLLHLIF